MPKPETRTDILEATSRIEKFVRGEDMIDPKDLVSENVVDRLGKYLEEKINIAGFLRTEIDFSALAYFAMRQVLDELGYEKRANLVPLEIEEYIDMVTEPDDPMDDLRQEIQTSIKQMDAGEGIPIETVRERIQQRRNCPLSHEPNETTIAALEAAKAGEVVPVESVAELFEDLEEEDA